MNRNNIFCEKKNILVSYFPEVIYWLRCSLIVLGFLGFPSRGMNPVVGCLLAVMTI